MLKFASHSVLKALGVRRHDAALSCGKHDCRYSIFYLLHSIFFLSAPAFFYNMQGASTMRLMHITIIEQIMSLHILKVLGRGSGGQPFCLNGEAYPAGGHAGSMELRCEATPRKFPLPLERARACARVYIQHGPFG